MPFWSLRSRAERIVADVSAYTGFDIVSILVDEWRERWLPGLIRDGLRVGLDWSGDSATGYEVAPADVEATLAAKMVSD
jgi:hypothetical protein